jgi:hypothetical protein
MAVMVSDSVSTQDDPVEELNNGFGFLAILPAVTVSLLLFWGAVPISIYKVILWLFGGEPAIHQHVSSPHATIDTLQHLLCVLYLLCVVQRVQACSRSVACVHR